MLAAEDEDDEIPADDFYHQTAVASSSKSNHSRHFSLSHNPPASARTPGTGGSVTSFADFISAPGSAGGRGGRRGAAGSRPGSASFRTVDFGLTGGGLFPKTPNAHAQAARGKPDVVEEPDEVLFDSDEPGASGRHGGGTSTTDENTSVSSEEERSRRDR